tara:strand:- start:228 stop:542 length:315 start_codon:yes stop_codon:yes gene_type:complete
MNQPFSLRVDELPKGGRKIINFVVVTPTTKALVETQIFANDKSLNAEAMEELILCVMNEFSFEPFLLVGITRDNASYMVKAQAALKQFDEYAHVLSVSCLSHYL